MLRSKNKEDLDINYETNFFINNNLLSKFLTFNNNNENITNNLKDILNNNNNNFFNINNFGPFNYISKALKQL